MVRLLLTVPLRSWPPASGGRAPSPAASDRGAPSPNGELEYRIPRLHSPVNSRRFPEIFEVEDFSKIKTSFPKAPIFKYSLIAGCVGYEGAMAGCVG